MKNLKLLLAAIAVFIFTAAKAQAPYTCTFTGCAPFNSSDNKQIVGAILNSTNVSIPASSTVNVKDNTSDTLNKRLGRIDQHLDTYQPYLPLIYQTNRYANIGSAEWINFGLVSPGGAYKPYLMHLNNKIDSLIQQNVTHTLALTSSTAGSSGTVTAGARSIYFETSSDFTGSIDGVAASASTVYTFSSGQYNIVLPQVVYAITAGSIKIRKFQ